MKLLCCEGSLLLAFCGSRHDVTWYASVVDLAIYTAKVMIQIQDGSSTDLYDFGNRATFLSVVLLICPASAAWLRPRVDSFLNNVGSPPDFLGADFVFAGNDMCDQFPLLD